MYQPPQEILDKYADLLVNFALNSGKGIKHGEVVLLQVPESAKPMLVSLRKSVLKSGAHPIIEYLPEGLSKDFFEQAHDHHLDFYPEKYLKGKVDQVDHSIHILADTDPKELEKIDPKKIMKRQIALKPYSDLRNKKENAGLFTWTLALYATKEKAKEANLSLEEYWEQIIKACYLDEANPIKKWQDLTEELERIKEKLDSLKIEKVRVKGENVDLEVKLGSKRKWMGGSGRNIPSFELFISPDWRGTNGKIKFNQPLYRYGNIIKDVELEFKDGIVINSKASQNEKVLKEMIATTNADKIGEFSLTDSRMSRITKFMAETLFDENVGGKQGNTHIALGKAYHDSFPGDPSKLTKEEWAQMGYNDSPIHTDIVSTEKREVTATLENGEEMIIYKEGKFTI